MKNNLLLFGGTFNPIHYGHLITSRYAFESLKEELNFEKIILIPNGNAPHKQGEIAPAHRFRMCEIAVQGDPQFMVSDLESSKTEKSYTIETVETLRDIFRNHVKDIWWLIGPDNLVEIKNWHRFSEFAGKINFLIGLAEGQGSYLVYDLKKQYERLGITVKFVKIPRIDIRSTLIRERRKQQLSISYYVPTSVESYIKENGLYL